MLFESFNEAMLEKFVERAVQFLHKIRPLWGLSIY